YELRGNLVQAETFFKDALKIKLKLDPNNPDAMQFLNKMADIARNRRDFVGAEKYLRRSLEFGGKFDRRVIDLGWTFKHWGDYLQNRERLTEAEAAYRRALDILGEDSPGSEDHAEVLAGLARVKQKTGNLDVAGEYWPRALAAIESQTARLGGSTEV